MGRKSLGAWLAALGGALWCGSYMWPLLNPFSLDVVLRGDWAQHTLGWLFFRREPLGFPLGPLGALHGFLHPLGTTLGYMDAIPWVALALRPLSALLPVDFQYLGLWILLSSATLAFVAARVFSWTTPHWEQQALAGLLIAMAPTLLERLIHPALCAHGFIVAAIALSCSASTRRTLKLAFVLLSVSGATHPYLAVMVLLLIAAIPWQLRAQLGTRVSVLATLAMFAWLAAELALLGYFDGGIQTTTRGFGAYSANLNTFINSMTLSRFFPPLPGVTRQYEGFCYLGAGCFFVIFVASVLLALPETRRRIVEGRWQRAIWPLFACCAMACFAAATPVFWGEHELLRIGLYERFEWLKWLTQTFRASGRFVWPLAYLLNLAACSAVLRGLAGRRALGSALLLIAVGLQLCDIDIGRTRTLFAAERTRVLASEEWSLAEQGFKHLALFPAEIQGTCDGPQGYRGEVVTELAYLAYRHGWTFNSGYAARVRPGTRAYCNQFKAQIERLELDPQTIYVVWRWSVRLLWKAGATCGRIDRTTVCVLPAQHAFARYLAAHPP